MKSALLTVVKLSLIPDYLWLFIFLTVSSYLPTAYAQRNNLTIAVPPFPPFAYFDETGKCIGSVEILIQKITQLSGVEFRLKDYPYARILNKLHYGHLSTALIFKNTQLLINNALFDKIVYLGPLSYSKILLITKDQDTIKEYSDIKKLKAIAVIRKASFNPQFDTDRTIQKVYVESYKQGLQMFISGRADAVIGSDIGLAHNMQKLQIPNDLLDSAYQLDQKEWGLHVVKKHLSKTQLKKLNQAIGKLYRHDLIYTLYSEHFSQQRECI